MRNKIQSATEHLSVLKRNIRGSQKPQYSRPYLKLRFNMQSVKFYAKILRSDLKQMEITGHPHSPVNSKIMNAHNFSNNPRSKSNLAITFKKSVHRTHILHLLICTANFY